MPWTKNGGSFSGPDIALCTSFCGASQHMSEEGYGAEQGTAKELCELQLPIAVTRKSDMHCLHLFVDRCMAVFKGRASPCQPAQLLSFAQSFFRYVSLHPTTASVYLNHPCIAVTSSFTCDHNVWYLWILSLSQREGMSSAYPLFEHRGFSWMLYIACCFFSLALLHISDHRLIS